MNVMNCFAVDCIVMWLLFSVFSETPLKQSFACFSTVLDIKCSTNELIVFNAARYGRNDTEIAAKCNTHYQRNCDVDAHFTLNRLCSGLSTCALVVNTELFGDPCGYEEFLKVTYRCVPGKIVQHVNDVLNIIKYQYRDQSVLLDKIHLGYQFTHGV